MFFRKIKQTKPIKINNIIRHNFCLESNAAISAIMNSPGKNETWYILIPIMNTSSILTLEDSVWIVMSSIIVIR